MTTSVSFIRSADENDGKEIYDMLKEMREEENRLSEFTISLEDFLRDGFSGDRLFDTLVAEEIDDSGKKHIIGFATYFYGYNGEVGKMMYLEDLFVRKNRRGKGYGSNLFKRVAEVGAEKGTKRMVWGVFDGPSGNARAMAFYKSMNAVDCDIRQLYLPI